MCDGEATASELKDAYEALVFREAKINDELEMLSDKCGPKREMYLLHKYNDLKDATQILLGAIGNVESVTVKELHERFGLPMDS